MHECTFCVLNENYVLNITCSWKLILIQKLNNFVTIFVLSRGDQKFFQAHHASKMLKVTSATQVKSRLISVRSIRHSNRKRIQKDAQQSNTCWLVDSAWSWCDTCTTRTRAPALRRPKRIFSNALQSTLIRSSRSQIFCLRGWCARLSSYRHVNTLYARPRRTFHYWPQESCVLSPCVFCRFFALFCLERLSRYGNAMLAGTRNEIELCTWSSRTLSTTLHGLFSIRSVTWWIGSNRYVWAPSPSPPQKLPSRLLYAAPLLLL